MKYVIHVGKHGDGFCMFDTKQIDYNVMHTPFKRDVVEEMAVACRKAGMPFGVYYSHRPTGGIPTSRTAARGAGPSSRTPNIDRYERYMCKQVEELVHNYGPLLTVWFDYADGFRRRARQAGNAIRPVAATRSSW